MATETRVLPRSNVKRNIALKNAAAKNTALGIASYLSTDTQDKLNHIEPIYKLAMQDVTGKTAVKVKAVATAEKTAILLKRKNSRFIQVLVLAVGDAIFPEADLAYYNLDSSGKVPPMKTDDEIAEVANNLIAGEAARVAAGGVQMAMPAISEVIALSKQLVIDVAARNAAITALTAAEATVNGYNELADDAILFAWNEVETHFGNLANPAIRVQGKLWGIIYAKAGGTKKVTGKVTDKNTGEPIANADIYFDNGNLSATSDDVGVYELNTTLMGAQLFIATNALYADWQLEETLVENENPVFNIAMIPLLIP